MALPRPLLFHPYYVSLVFLQNPFSTPPPTSRLKLQAGNGRKTVARTVTGVLSRTFLNASQMSQVMASHGFLAKLGERPKARPRNSAVNAAPDPPSSPTDRRARVGFRDEAAPSAPNRASSKVTARAEKGLLCGLFGSETSAVDGIASGPRDKGATESRSPPLGVRLPRKQERNRRENPGVLDESMKTSTATGDSGSLRAGSHSRRKQTPENNRDVSTVDSPTQGTAVVTSPPKLNQQEAKTRKRADQNYTTFETKKSDPETTVNPAEEGGAVESKTNDRIPGNNNVQAALKRLSAPRPQPQSSHPLKALPAEVKPHSPSVSSRAPPKASASAAASGAVRSIPRVIPGGNNLAAARKNGTAEVDDASGAGQNGRGAVDEDMGGPRNYSHRTRDQPRQARWHDVDVLKVRNPNDRTKVAANSVMRGSDGGGNKSRSPSASSVALPGGGYTEEAEDNNATPAVTASPLSATTASYGQNTTGIGDTGSTAPSLELQLHFIGVGA